MISQIVPYWIVSKQRIALKLCWDRGRGVPLRWAGAWDGVIPFHIRQQDRQKGSSLRAVRISRGAHIPGLFRRRSISVLQPSRDRGLGHGPNGGLVRGD